MLDRAWTAAVVALVALVPGAPLGMKVYAAAASAERAAAVAAAERLLPEPFPVSRRTSAIEYEMRAWEGETLVPVAGYRVELSYALSRPTAPAAVLAWYERTLSGWDVRHEGVACASLALRPGCGAVFATFTSDEGMLRLNLAEYLAPDGSLRDYGVQVSQ